MQVVDTDNTVLFDSTTELTGEDGFETPSIAPLPGPDNMARAPIVVGDKAVGSVRVWVYGSDSCCARPTRSSATVRTRP